MSTDAPDRSTSARLAQASERLSILAHELAIAVGARADLGRDRELFMSISRSLSTQALDLAEITFAVAEDVVSSSHDPRADRSAAALGRVSRIIEPVFEIASELAAHLTIRAEAAARDGRPLAAADLSSLDAPIVRLLRENDHLVTGAGVAAPGALSDRDLWMRWWVQGPTTPVPLSPQLDPGAAGFYDYPSAVWFRPSARDLAPHLAPPSLRRRRHRHLDGDRDHSRRRSTPPRRTGVRRAHRRPRRFARRLGARGDARASRLGLARGARRREHPSRPASR